MFSQETVTKRLFKDDREFILFKVNVTPEMFDTYNTKQIEYLNQLFTMTDERLQKH